MKPVRDGFEPVPHGFMAVRVLPEPIASVRRAIARSDWRIFRARSGLEVAIAEEVVQNLVAFGKRAEPKEWYALLVGRLCKDEKGTHVTVDGAVFDRHAIATRGSIQTTPTSEFQTRQLARFQYPGRVPIGWAHGHVRCGARYSEVDRQNQRTWTQTHSVGIVVDPWDPKLLSVYLGPESELLEPITDQGSSAAQSVEQTSIAHSSQGPEPPTHAARERGVSLPIWLAAWSLPFIAIALTTLFHIDGLARQVAALTVDVGVLQHNAQSSKPSSKEGDAVLPPSKAKPILRSKEAVRPQDEWRPPMDVPANPTAAPVRSPGSDLASTACSKPDGGNDDSPGCIDDGTQRKDHP